jgi:hypothetical protein
MHNVYTHAHLAALNLAGRLRCRLTSERGQGTVESSA